MIVYFSIFWSLYLPIVTVSLSVVAARLRHFIGKALILTPRAARVASTSPTPGETALH
jgi:hypothetical protein